MISGVATVCGVVVTLCVGAGVTADTGAVVTGDTALADVAEELAGVVLVTGDEFVVDASAGYVAVASVVVAVGFAATVCTT